MGLGFVEDMPASQLTKPDAVSTVPSMVHGDWVLFHPAYTPEELKAVEVRNSSFTMTIVY